MTEPTLRSMLRKTGQLSPDPEAKKEPDPKPTPGPKPEPEPKPDTDKEASESACPKGVFVSKYKRFLAQVPDFDFVKFYSDLDKYFGSAEEALKPQGKDCVFGDEHYAAWIKLQQKKQTGVPYISESMRMLRGLIKEMKKRY